MKNDIRVQKERRIIHSHSYSLLLKIILKQSYSKYNDIVIFLITAEFG